METGAESCSSILAFLRHGRRSQVQQIGMAAQSLRKQEAGRALTELICGGSIDQVVDGFPLGLWNIQYHPITHTFSRLPGHYRQLLSNPCLLPPGTSVHHNN